MNRNSKERRARKRRIMAENMIKISDQLRSKNFTIEQALAEIADACALLLEDAK